MSSKIIETKTSFDEEKKVWRGPSTKINIGSDVSIGSSIIESLLKFPDHISQISNGRCYTNEEILTLSIRVAQNLQSMGVQQEDVIGICASNTDLIAPLVFGALLCGATLSTLDPSFDKDGIRHIFSITKPKFMFCDGSVYENVRDSFALMGLSVPIYTMKDHLKGVKQIQELIVSTGKEGAFTVTPLKFGSAQTAVILCSSGTTGLPKGVSMSHESLLNTRVFDITQDGKLLCFSTLYWISGLYCLLQGTLTGHTRIITDQQYSPELFFKLIEQYKITSVFSPPSQMIMAVGCADFKQRKLASVEVYICVGGGVPLSVVEELANHAKSCQVLLGYGMSEISGGCSLGRPLKPGANGQLMSNVTLKIVDDAGNKLGIGESGEICIKTPYKWSGYYGNPEATVGAVDSEGFFCSGDIGFFDEDGTLLITGRKKDILKYNNFHFFPGEIEDEIFKIPDVVEVCVCGIPDVISSFLPAAAVVRVPNSKLSEEDICTHVAGRMAHFKQLRGGVYFLDSLPKTASGKNLRTKCTQIVEQMRNQRKEFD